MDAAASMGLASNIMQFVDFSWKLFQEARDLYNSSTGASPENDILEVVSRDLSFRIHRVNAIAQRHVTIPESMITLIYQCDKVANKLLKTLDLIKLQTPHKKWGSFVQALRSVWKKDKIAGLVRQLERLRDEVLFALRIM